MLEFNNPKTSKSKKVADIPRGTTFRWGIDNKEYLMTDCGVVVIPDGVQSDYTLVTLSNYRETTIVCEVKEI